MLKRLALVYLVTLFLIGGVEGMTMLESERTGEPITVYEFGKDYLPLSVASDGKYILITEYQKNKTVEIEKTDGYRWRGNMYLYHIADKTLTKIPGNIPAEKAVIADESVIWLTPHYFYHLTENNPSSRTVKQEYYQYTVGEKTPYPVNYTANWATNRFAADEDHLISVYGNFWPYDLTYTLYNRKTDEKSILSLEGNPNPDSLHISKNYLLYTGSRNQTIHIYTIDSGNLYLLENPDSDIQRIEYLWGDSLVYSEWNKTQDGRTKPEYWITNVTTRDTFSFNVPTELASSSIHDLHMPIMTWVVRDEQSGRDVVKMMQYDQTPLSAQTQQAGPAPYGCILTLAAFLGLIRKKNNLGYIK